VIVVDDGSDDGSASVARAFGRAVRVFSQARASIGVARNRAVAMASGEHFSFLDADDRFVADKIERQMDAMRADHALDAVFGHVREFVSPDIAPEVAARLRPPAGPTPWPSTSLMLVRRQAYARVGGFSTTLRVGVGLDWYARATELGLKMLVLPAVLLERRLHADNNGLREAGARLEYTRVLRAALDRRRRLEAGPPGSGP
jgi:glycosyltransferase involved in cell wall biosynthesis